MIELQRWRPATGSQVRVGVVSTYPPTRCGIARFTQSMVESVEACDDSVSFDVVRLVAEPASDGECGYPVTMEFDPSSHVGLKAAAAHLNRSDAAVISHEFGIFGPDDGSPVVELAHLLQVPTVTILHTVLPEPTSRQRQIIEQLAQTTTLVVLCDAALDIVTSAYDVSADRVEVIPHGATWDPQPVNHSPRRRLITWGLLGPGKNLEQAIAAVAELDQFDPPVQYQIVGRLHPAFVRSNGNGYRTELSRLVFDLGLEDRVEFIDRYVDDAELLSLVRQADLVLVPYGNSDQVSSGVITEAIGAGRPVVSTRFPYADEMLATGAGVVVDHDPSSLATGMHQLLDDAVAYRRAARAASELSADLSWRNVGRRYARLFHQIALSRATA